MFQPERSNRTTTALAVRMRGMQHRGVAGRLGIVMRREKYEQFARMLGILAIPDRPMRFFTDDVAARAWLDAPDVRAWTADHPQPAAGGQHCPASDRA